MDMLQHLLQSDAAAPRLTFYNESSGARMDFSAQTLDNWVSKIANFFQEELELDPVAALDSKVLVHLPTSWQPAVIALGAMAAGVPVAFNSGELEGSVPDVVFTSPGEYEEVSQAFATADVVLVTDDPFGRGVVESGGELPTGAIDFGPTVRFYGDQFFGPTTALPQQFPDAGPAQRIMASGWSDAASFRDLILKPLAAGGSAVIVSGICPAERLDEIAGNEKVDVRL
ncbi:TPA: TIGR03089 family protein [Corynebacterium striatum]|uniref:TIGR03089 family protein n=1 Tax=Corynebacterium striatum TaxID=43770 RepID=UPI00254A7C62|nr:TIGR03089 family protein [Corynebacterium striatum]MDK7884213.1 TIGR03089 family protein [Corynebacterium striatum]HCD4228297.1 TIGR03089 family protein [Corynebacterium striatum]